MSAELQLWRDFADAQRALKGPALAIMHPDTAKTLGVPADIVDQVMAGTLTLSWCWREDLGGGYAIGLKPALIPASEK